MASGEHCAGLLQTPEDALEAGVRAQCRSTCVACIKPWVQFPVEKKKKKENEKKRHSFRNEGKIKTSSYIQKLKGFSIASSYENVRSLPDFNRKMVSHENVALYMKLRALEMVTIRKM